MLVRRSAVLEALAGRGSGSRTGGGKQAAGAPGTLPPTHPHPQVLRFNGTEVRNLRHLAEMAAACTEPYMRFDLEYNVSSLFCFIL